MCTAASRAHVEVWRMVWGKLDDRGDYLPVRVDDEQRRVVRGNALADEAAPLGAGVHPRMCMVAKFCLAQQTTRSPLSSPTRNLSASSVFHSDWGQALSEEDQALAMDIIEPKLVEWGYLTGRSHSHH